MRNIHPWMFVFKPMKLDHIIQQAKTCPILWAYPASVLATLRYMAFPEFPSQLCLLIFVSKLLNLTSPFPDFLKNLPEVLQIFSEVPIP